MSFDYEELSELAQEMIEESGRVITFVQFNNTPANANKPWRGATDPRATPISTLEVSGVFVEPVLARKLGILTKTEDLIKRSTKIIMVATTVDLSIFQEVIDTDSTRWKIIEFEQLKPGNTTLIYYVWVER